MAHTRPMIVVLEEMAARLVTIEAATNANTAAIAALASDQAAIRVEVERANALAEYMATHTYGADPALP